MKFFTAILSFILTMALLLVSLLAAGGGGPAGLVLYGSLSHRPAGGLEGSRWGDAGDDPVLIRSIDGGKTWEGLAVQ